MPVEKQVLIIYAAVNAFLDDIPVEQVRKFESELFTFVENSHPGLLHTIREKRELTNEIKTELNQVLNEFKERFTAAAKAAASA